VEARLDGRVLRSTGGPFVQRVLGAAVGPDGHPAVVVTAANGALAVVGPGGQVQLGADGFSLAGICVNKWGELQCLCARAGVREIVTFQQLYGRWTETELIETRGPVADMACVGRRGGISVAVAGDDGLWVASQQDGVLSEWQRLTAEPCQRVVLEVGAAWRLRLAALIGGRVAVATEDVSGSWSRGLKEL
jgi:hypothetical protein